MLDKMTFAKLQHEIYKHTSVHSVSILKVKVLAQHLKTDHLKSVQSSQTGDSLQAFAKPDSPARLHD